MARHHALFAALLLLTSCSSSTEPPAEASSITLSSTNVTFASLLATQTLTATVRDANGSTISVGVTWSTSAPGVASVSSSGQVTAVGNGTAQITASAGTAQSPPTTVTVLQVAATLTLSPDTLRLAAASDTATIGRTVRDAGGSAMSGVAVTFATNNASVATVDVSSGRVTAQSVGATTITAQAAIGVTDNIRVEIGGNLPPVYLVGGYVGAVYTDQLDAASGGGTFTYTVTAGALPPGLSLNSTSRQITGTPNTSGVHFFQVTATNGTLTLSERFAITISTKASSAFNLWVTYNGGRMPAANVRTALSAALARFENIITGDPGTTVTYPSSGFSNQCILVTGALLHNAVVEDVAILMALDSIDGAGNTLARAGFCGITRAAPPVVSTGQMLIDSLDAASASATYLEDVIWHEIGHVLGIGTLQTFTTGVGTPTPTFSGPNAKAEWTTLSDSTTNVPMEPDLAGHWHEGWFNAEIMTPITEGSSVRLPISRLTIGALIDFGWTASLGAADAYTLPGCRPTCTIGEPAGAFGEGARIPDFVIEKVVPLPPGSVARN